MPARGASGAAALAAGLALTSLACARLIPPPASPEPAASPRPKAPGSSPTPAGTGTVSVHTLPDGSLEVIDHELGCRFVLPGAWWAVPLQDLPLEAALEQAGALRPELAPLLDALGPGLSENARLVALHADPAPLLAGFPRTAVLASLGPRRQPLPVLLDITALALQAIVPETGSIERGLQQSAAGLPFGRIDVRLPAPAPGERNLALDVNTAFFESAGQLVALVLITPAGAPEGSAALFDSILASLALAPG